MGKKKCIFCLEAQTDQHLIVSIGEEAYMTYSKGGITNEHMMLFPIEHFEGQLCFPAPLMGECTKYIEAMASYCDNTGKRLLVWERCIPTRINHSFFELLPIPSGTEWEDALKREAAQSRLDFFTLDDKHESLKETTDGKPYMLMYQP